ncbi:putative sodium bile acid cotransporter [Gorgonomyces haynaldii]|nr:putative sodium bile acid cotransporter [Gorgonomyces haynaldii]
MSVTVVLFHEPPKPSYGTRLTATLKKHWFLVGLVVAIGLAAAWPIAGSKNGPLRTDFLIGYAVTSMIFLISGLGMKTKVLSKALMHWKLILIVQVVTFCISPVICFGISKLLFIASFDSNLVAGLMITFSTPTAIASNTLLTKQAKGNDAATVINAVLGNVLGAFISPLLIFGYLGNGGSSDPVQFSRVFMKLGITVLAPLLVGQLIQFLWPVQVERLQKKVSFCAVSSGLLLIIIWSVFCDSFIQNIFSIIAAWQTAVVFVLEALLICMFAFLCYAFSKWLRFSLEDRIAITMCGTTKTSASLGIPLINVIYVGSPYIGVMSIPLLAYVGLQLIIGSVIVTVFLSMHSKRQIA